MHPIAAVTPSPWTPGLLSFGLFVALVLGLLGAFRLDWRKVPNRAGPWGLGQPIADAVKLLAKEDVVPAGADRFIFLYAPVVVAATAILIFAVVPFAQGWTVGGQAVPGVITDLNVGLLYVYALSSLAVYSVALGGWASNSKYSLLGAIRGAAQMISYELALGLSLVPVGMMAKSFSLVDIVNAQARWPFILVQPLAFVIIWIRGTPGRLRYDQLMHLGWKLLLPVALLNIIVTGGVLLALGS